MSKSLAGGAFGSKKMRLNFLSSARRVAAVPVGGRATQDKSLRRLIVAPPQSLDDGLQRPPLYLLHQSPKSISP